MPEGCYCNVQIAIEMLREKVFLFCCSGMSYLVFRKIAIAIFPIFTLLIISSHQTFLIWIFQRSK